MTRYLATSVFVLFCAIMGAALLPFLAVAYVLGWASRR